MRQTGMVVMALGVALGVGVREVRATEFPGTGTLTGRARLKVRSCGKTTDAANLVVSVAADGAWVIDDGTTTLAGTGAIVGKAGRRLLLTLDEASTASVVARLEAEASALCGTPAAATEVETRKALLKVNAKGTRARLVEVIAAAGVGGGDATGKGKYRLLAAGPWIGPLSCEEVFACTRACAAGDAACVDACMAQATLATQDDVTTLNACVDAACPLADPVCVGGAIAGTCKAAYEACVPPPPPTNLTCEEIFDCTADCAGQRCIDDCFDRGSERGRDEATAVSTCVNRVCPSGGAACQRSALAGACAYVWETCTGTPPPRNLACDAILDCLATCPAGGAACAADCRERGSVTGRDELAALEGCIDAACPTRAPTCVANTVTGQCHVEWQMCLG